MKASVVDLRYQMRDILKALDRGEEVKIFYHKKIKGIIKPVNQLETTLKSVRAHPFCGMLKGSNLSVQEQMKKLRGGRYNDL